MRLSQPTLEPHSLCYTCWGQVVYSLLPLLYFFLLDTLLLLSSCRREGVRSALPGLRGLLGVRLPVDVPVAPCSASESFYRILYFASTVSDIFVINVINIFVFVLLYLYSWYVLWYTVHSVVYTCDLILERIWLLSLCPFINRVLHFGPCTCVTRAFGTQSCLGSFFFDSLTILPMNLAFTLPFTLLKRKWLFWNIDE